MRSLELKVSPGCVSHMMLTCSLAAGEASVNSHAEMPMCTVLDGTAVNQDGRSSSLTAPHGPSQQQASTLILPLMSGCQQALIEGEVDPEHLVGSRTGV